MHRLAHLALVVASGSFIAAVTGCSSDTTTPPTPPADTGPADTGGGTDTGSDTAPAPNTVTVGAGGGFTFSPSTLTVKVGDTVTWKWEGSGHNVLADDGSFCSPSDSGCSGTVPTSTAGTTYTHKFDKAGDFPYHCVPHQAAGMTGKITVSP